MKRSGKILLSMILATAIVLSLCVSASAAYSDVKSGAWYETYVEQVTQAKLMNGVGNGRFAPEDILSREMFVTVLHRLMGSPAASAKATFPDVVQSAYYAGAVAWAHQTGVVYGYADGRFGVGDAITREQLIAILYRAFGEGELAGSSIRSNLNDGDSVSAYACEAMDWALAYKLLEGSGGWLSPQANTTRAQLAKILSKLLELLASREGSNGNHSTGANPSEPPAPSPEPDALSRGDLEQAITETAFAYFNKGSQIQYCSQELTDGLSKYYGGTYRVSEKAAPEFGSSDTNIYSVCSDYVYKVYDEALGHQLFGAENYLDAVTTAMWMFCEDVVLMRWIRDGYSLNEKELAFGVTEDTRLSLEDARAFLRNWKETLRPGDVILPQGHAMLYVGNGYVVDCWGSKYAFANGIADGQERFERDGSVHVLHTVEDLYLTGEDPVNDFYLLDENTTLDWFAVFRPLDALVEKGSGKDPSGDLAKSGVSITAATASRLDYPGLEIDRTVCLTPYGTFSSGETYTYSIQISNHSNEECYQKCRTDACNTTYRGLCVKEVLPEGTVLIPDSLDPVAQVSGNTITWMLDDLAAGERTQLTYRVRVSADLGSTIVSEGGFVAEIPSNSISNTVGGQKISQSKLDQLQTLAEMDPAQWREIYNISRLGTDLVFAERVYAKAMGIALELPSVQELIEKVLSFEPITEASGSRRYEGSMTASLFREKDTISEADHTLKAMFVDGYLGGRKLFFADKSKPINEFRQSYLERGDILVYAQTDKEGRVTETEVMVYAMEDKLLSLESDGTLSVLTGANRVDAKLWSAFAKDVFFLLRPSQAVPDINSLVYDKSSEPEYDEEPENPQENFPWQGAPLNETHTQALAALNASDWTEKNTAFAEAVYSKIGLDIAKTGTCGQSAAKILTALFDTYGNAPAYQYQPRKAAKVSDAYQRLAAMLVKELRGGPQMIDDGSLSQLTPEKLEPGDILYLVNRADSRYWVGICIGPEKLLLCQYQQSCYQTYQVCDFSGETGHADFSALLTEEQAITGYTEGGAAWECFFVLRPYRGYDDINTGDVAPLPEKTAKEKVAAVAAWTTQDTAGWTEYITAFAEKVYDALGLDLTVVTRSTTPATMLKNNYVFVKPNTKNEAPVQSASGYTVQPKAESDVIDVWKPFYTALVYYGGERMYDTAGVAMTDAVISLNDMEIGDILYLIRRNGSCYWTAIYQGQGKFLVAAANGSDYHYSVFTAETDAAFAALLKTVPNAEETWECYYVLRPYLALDGLLGQ